MAEQRKLGFQLMCVERATNTRLGDDVIYLWTTFRMRSLYSLAQSIPLAKPNTLNMKI